MTRARVAAVLGVVAVLCVVATAAVALTREDTAPDAPTLTVAGPEGSFEVPADGWKVEDADVRVFYADEQGRPVAVVHGPAVFRAGYCGKDSNQAFAGFTREPLGAWTGALGEAGPVDREAVVLEDGTVARLSRVDVEVDSAAPCSASRVEVSMLEVGGVRAVLVRDAGALPDDDVLLSLELS
ncbi:hypothetical protein [Nocardioides caricicola]|uniref:DUF8017 domain-containing protein n=1 Tax=Nocardioides caricicola TaxID=634770 RepID=A0ABW0MXG3_9ACTN